MSLSDDDWQLLNAYHDGELSRADARAVRARLRSEPAMQAALSDLGAISGALAPLRPGHGTWPREHRRFLPWAGCALAAASVTAMAIGLGAMLLDRGGRDPSPLGWHQTFLERSYSVENGGAAPRLADLWMGRRPDLSSANMTLVDVAMAKGGDVYLHYSGVNGCRLTVGAHAAAPVLPALSDDMRLHSWSAGETHYSMQAKGMDAGKFAAILLYLEDFTRQGLEKDEMMAVVRAATSTALPCA